MATSGNPFLDTGFSFLNEVRKEEDRDKELRRQENITDFRRETDYLRQKEFAQMGIQWRVEDAKAAGLHPVFALNGGGAAFSSPSVSTSGSYGVENSLQDLGQNVSRAVAAQETPEQREVRLMNFKVQESNITRNEAEAAYYRAQEAKIRGAGPGMPSTLLGPSGQNVTSGTGQQSVVIPDWDQYEAGNIGAVQLKPNEVVSSVLSRPYLAPGVKPMWDKADFGLPGMREMYVPRTDDFWETWGELSWYDKLGLFMASNYLSASDKRAIAQWERNAAGDASARFGGSRQRGGNLHWGKIRR